jgi:hypothetical protein
MVRFLIDGAGIQARQPGRTPLSNRSCSWVSFGMPGSAFITFPSKVHRQQTLQV